MTTSQTHRNVLHTRAHLFSNSVALPSPGVGRDAKKMEETLRSMQVVQPVALVSAPKSGVVTEEGIFEARLRAKLLMANVAMHISSDWRASLFRQLDDILDINEWESGDPFPTPDSMRTFLRMIIYLTFRKCPGLGLSGGSVVAAWTESDQRLTIECLPADRIHWVFSKRLNDFLEIGSGETLVTRLPDVLAPYVGQPNWVFDGQDQP